MKVTLLRKDELDEFYNVVRGIINNTDYYTKKAKNNEIAKFTKKAMAKNLKDKTNITLVARDEGKMLGFLNGYFEHGDVFYLYWIGVSKNARGKGAGKEILKELSFEERKV